MKERTVKTKSDVLAKMEMIERQRVFRCHQVGRYPDRRSEWDHKSPEAERVRAELHEMYAELVHERRMELAREHGAYPPPSWVREHGTGRESTSHFRERPDAGGAGAAGE